MGYKPGAGIGKKGDGRANPIPIEVKADRSGLGRSSEMKRKQAESQALQALMLQKRMRQEKEIQGNFRTRMSSKVADRHIESDLHKSQKVCEQLDSEKGLEKPAEQFFWPVASLPKKKTYDLEEGEGYSFEVQDQDGEEQEEDEEDELEPTAKLEILTLYLRNTHMYCVWCGTAFEDSDDMRINCPGPSSEAHKDFI
ncbi:G patch domain-containing protein 11-like [Lingula anatina]|uniref:G patch domain-containing protein 11 n=1 Tax=Lingula anatina TaxID=7574 RepID=A0A1S3IGT0_LINAN|nr:G patch domain-containing protein 11-like [Lingula anatina]|eukprot:XP_013397470.2 G patch domain-containing protein 11-like [Lingula anatina]